MHIYIDYIYVITLFSLDKELSEMMRNEINKIFGCFEGFRKKKFLEKYFNSFFKLYIA